MKYLSNSSKNSHGTILLRTASIPASMRRDWTGKSIGFVVVVAAVVDDLCNHFPSLRQWWWWRVRWECGGIVEYLAVTTTLSFKWCESAKDKAICSRRCGCCLCCCRVQIDEHESKEATELLSTFFLQTDGSFSLDGWNSPDAWFEAVLAVTLMYKRQEERHGKWGWKSKEMTLRILSLCLTIIQVCSDIYYGGERNIEVD